MYIKRDENDDNEDADRMCFGGADTNISILTFRTAYHSSYFRS